MNKEAVVAITFGFSAFIKKRIGLKKIPPPIPTIPETRPMIAPIKRLKKELIFFMTKLLFWYDLLFINNNNPAIDKTKNKRI